jgi:hypothetical protein
MRKEKIDALALEAFSLAVTHAGEQKLTALLTKKEKVLIGRRLLIAHAIIAGKTRMEVQAHMSVSPNTFTQIRRWVDSEFSVYYPANQAVGPTRQRRHKTQPFSLAHLEQKYPAHFLLFTLSKKLFK